MSNGHEAAEPLLGEPSMDSELIQRKSIVQWLLGAIRLASFIAVLVFTFLWFGREAGGFTLDKTDARLFNLHPVLMVIGPICSSSFAVTLFKNYKQNDRVLLKRLHMMLHLFSMVCVLVAVVAVYTFHSSHNLPHFNSLHAVLGLVLLITFCIVVIFSFVVFYFPQAPSRMRFYLIHPHKIIGMFLVLVAFPAVGLVGIMEKLLFIKACDATNTTPICLYGKLIALLILCISGLTLSMVLKLKM